MASHSCLTDAARSPSGMAEKSTDIVTRSSCQPRVAPGPPLRVVSTVARWALSRTNCHWALARSGHADRTSLGAVRLRAPRARRGRPRVALSVRGGSGVHVHGPAGRRASLASDLPGAGIRPAAGAHHSLAEAG